MANREEIIRLMNRLAALVFAAGEQMDVMDKELKRLDQISTELNRTAVLATELLTTYQFNIASFRDATPSGGSDGRPSS